MTFGDLHFARECEGFDFRGFARQIEDSLRFMNVRIEPTWGAVLGAEFDKMYWRVLTDFVRREYAAGVCYPPGGLIFNAFNLCPFDRTRVVILGQDPYHGPGQAHGLCFSVPPGVPSPPSLRNIFKEVCEDTGRAMPDTGNLMRWAEQGVLLLNSVLTVRQHVAASHAGQGWETFTDAVIAALASRREHLVFMLWGGYAQRKGAMIDEGRHLVLRAPHPSPLSAYAGFFGQRHFTRCNEYLVAHGGEAIEW